MLGQHDDGHANLRYLSRDVVADLEDCGIATSDINLIANKYVCEETVRADVPSAAGWGAGAGAVVGGTGGLLAGLGVITIPGLGPVVAVGTLAAIAVGATAGAVMGGVVGALVRTGMPERDAEIYCEAVRRGGTMVSVHVTDDRAAYVEQIVDRHGPVTP